MKKHFLLAMLVTLAVLLSLGAAAQADAGEDAFAEGQAWYYGTDTGTLDYEKAEAAFQVAADAGVADAWYYLGRIAYQRCVYAPALAAFETGAELGSELARLNLGIMYENGEGVEADYEKAAALFQEAVDNGCVEANCGLGNLYQNGHGVEADAVRALDYFLLAAESDEPEWVAYASLSLYEIITEEDATELPLDSEQAARWAEMGLEPARALAEAGNPYFTFMLAYFYYAGINYEQDYDAAMSWFLKSAEAGNVRAMYFIGYMYGKGFGVEESWEDSFTWHLKAAEGGYVSSMYTVGCRYAAGKGVEQNNDAAIAWLQKAADAGHEKAAEYLAELTGQ